MYVQNGAGLENILPWAAATMRKHYANAITSSLEFLQMYVPSLRIRSNLPRIEWVVLLKVPFQVSLNRRRLGQGGGFLAFLQLQLLSIRTRSSLSWILLGVLLKSSSRMFFHRRRLGKRASCSVIRSRVVGSFLVLQVHCCSGRRRRSLLSWISFGVVLEISPRISLHRRRLGEIVVCSRICLPVIMGFSAREFYFSCSSAFLQSRLI